MATLTQEQKHEVCQLLAEFWPNQDIQAHFRQKYGLEIDSSQVTYYKTYNHWPKLIQELREKWTSRLADEILANKRARLGLLKNAHDLAFEGYEAGKGTVRSPHAAIQALEAARREMEGDRVSLMDPDGKPLQAGVFVVPARVADASEWERLVNAGCQTSHPDRPDKT